jgi:hypothetical protein
VIGVQDSRVLTMRRSMTDCGKPKWWLMVCLLDTETGIHDSLAQLVMVATLSEEVENMLRLSRERSARRTWFSSSLDKLHTSQARPAMLNLDCPWGAHQQLQCFLTVCHTSCSSFPCLDYASTALTTHLLPALAVSVLHGKPRENMSQVYTHMFKV